MVAKPSVWRAMVRQCVLVALVGMWVILVSLSARSTKGWFVHRLVHAVSRVEMMVLNVAVQPGTRGATAVSVLLGTFSLLRVSSVMPVRPLGRVCVLVLVLVN